MTIRQAAGSLLVVGISGTELTGLGRCHPDPEGPADFGAPRIRQLVSRGFRGGHGVDHLPYSFVALTALFSGTVSSRAGRTQDSFSGPADHAA